MGTEPETQTTKIMGKCNQTVGPASTKMCLSHLYFSLKAQAVTSPAHHTRTKLACGRLIIAYRFDGAFYSGLFDEIGISAGTEMAGLRILPSTIDCRYRQVQLKEQQVWAAVLEQWEQV